MTKMRTLVVYLLVLSLGVEEELSFEGLGPSGRGAAVSLCPCGEEECAATI